MNGEVLLIIIVGIVYLALNLLPPTPPHIIGLVLTVTILAGYLD